MTDKAVETALLDRDDELAAVDTVLDRAAAGAGSVLVLEGPAGSGKSALIGAARRRAQHSDLRVLSARGGELELDHPFGIVRQLYEPLLRAAGARRRARLLAGAAAPSAWVLGLAEVGSGVYAAGFGAMNALYWLTAALAAERPLLLAVDDVQWADASSLRALDYLARRVRELPIALLLALRSDEPGSQDDLLDQLRTGEERAPHTLRPLRPASVAQIVRDRIPGANADTCAAAHTVTAGNPFYLQELLRALSATDATPGADDVRRASIPSLGDRVTRRAATVAPAAPALARAMAVLGDGARLQTAAALASVPKRDAIDIAHRLRRIEVLAAEDPIAFAHPLVRSSVYDAMPEGERQSTHRRAATLLEEGNAPPEAIASHLRVLTPSGDSGVAAALLAAGESAMHRAAPDEAVGWLRRGLDEGATTPLRVQLLSQLGRALTVQRDPAAIGCLQEAYELAPEPRLRGSVANMLAELLTLAGQWDAAIAVIDSVERELDGAAPDIETEIAGLRAAITLFDPQRIGEFDARRGAYLKLAEGDRWASHAIAALLAVEASHRGRPQEAVAFAERAFANGRLLGERAAGASWAALAIGGLIEADELDRATAFIELLDAASRASGAMLGSLTAILYRGWVNARRGDLAAADADLLTAFEVAQDAGLLMGVTTAVFCLSDVLLERDAASPVADLVEHVELGPDFLSSTSGGMLLEIRGRLRLLRRDRAGGIDDLRVAGRSFSTCGFGPAFSSWRSSLALALPSADRTEARALAEEELALARSTGLARPAGVALRTLGALGDSGPDLELLHESIEVLEDSPAVLELARSLVELGSALRRANRRADARGPLARGVEIARACGAQRLTERATQELRAAGGRRSRIATSGRDSLTASELRVVKLAAAGATNTEIAQDLYVSLKTVETHLTRAYVKLGLSGPGSRSQLARILDRSPGKPSATTD